jgi:hypothetical protein
MSHSQDREVVHPNETTRTDDKVRIAHKAAEGNCDLIHKGRKDATKEQARYEAAGKVNGRDPKPDPEQGGGTNQPGQK